LGPRWKENAARAALSALRRYAVFIIVAILVILLLNLVPSSRAKPSGSPAGIGHSGTTANYIAVQIREGYVR
jgi:hypothetical protein